METVGPPGPSVERRIVVTGRVQGVGYRWFAREAAHALGVTGWVRNLPDGTVALEIAAPEPIVAQFAAELRAGPPGAVVAHVLVTERTDRAPLPDRFHVVR